MLLLKMVLSPALIGIASWVSRRWGAAAGGWFSALPLTSGPVMFVIALERGPAFAMQASLGTLMAIISLAAYVLAYGRLSRRIACRGSWIVCSAAGCVAYLACTLALRDVPVSLPIAFAIVCVALVVTLRAMPAHAAGGASMAIAAARPVWWDIPLRMMLAAALVFTLTRIAGTLGPRLSGLLTPFPIGVTILAAFTHHVDGAAAASQLLRGLVGGLFSFAIFFLVTGLVITRWPVMATFAVAAVTTLTWHAMAGDVCAAVVHRWRVARGI